MLDKRESQLPDAFFLAKFIGSFKLYEFLNLEIEAVTVRVRTLIAISQKWNNLNLTIARKTGPRFLNPIIAI